MTATLGQADGGVDGLPGHQGTFIACTFWLVDALANTSRRDAAPMLFEQLLALRNDLSLLAEEYDTSARRQLGNTPQAYSHVGLINAARHLSGTRPSSSRGPSAEAIR